jgi:hypothetical protein
MTAHRSDRAICSETRSPSNNKDPLAHNAHQTFAGAAAALALIRQKDFVDSSQREVGVPRPTADGVVVVEQAA